MLISLEESFREHDAGLSATRCEQTMQRGFPEVGLQFYFDMCFNVQINIIQVHLQDELGSCNPVYSQSEQQFRESHTEPKLGM
jgi:hypothetical protein